MTDELRFTTELKIWKYKIERLARRFGLDFFPIMYNVVTSQEMSEIVARHGFPTAPHHWRYGQSSVNLKQQFRYGRRIYEIVLNTVPAYTFLLQVNDLITQKAVMAHVPGHVDMNKNNLFFKPTNRSMVNTMSSDALMVERLCEVIGSERVKEFYDHILSFEWCIDPNALYRPQQVQKRNEENQTEHPNRLWPKRIKPRDELPSYMDELLNPPDWLEKETGRLREELKQKIDVERGMKIPTRPERDMLLFLMRHAPLERWQRDLIAMIRRHSYYFAPMRRAKVMHEGWATLWEEEIMTESEMIGPHELTQFTQELAGVQRKGGGLNPYRLGYEIWKDIKMRWDTGRHGNIWEMCEYRSVKDGWDYFAVFKILFDDHGPGTEAFAKAWHEFSAFVAELKKGNLGYPKEFFIREMFTREHLLPMWARYLNVEQEYERFSGMQEKMEPLELEAVLLAKKLQEESSKDAPEELALKARHDVYDSAGTKDLWLWTLAEVRRELSELNALRLFKERWKSGEITCDPLAIEPEWQKWAGENTERIVLGKGLEKIFEVRVTHDDLMFLEEFFTKDFCEENEYFIFKAKTVWDPLSWDVQKHYVIESRSFKRIKKRLLFQYTNGFFPIIRVTNANHQGRGELYLVHEHTGVDLDYWSKDGMYISDVLTSLFYIWGGHKAVHLETIKTQKEEEKPWWHSWHQSRTKTANAPEVLSGKRVRFSIVYKNGKPEFKETELGDVTYEAPF